MARHRLVHLRRLALALVGVGLRLLLVIEAALRDRLLLRFALERLPQPDERPTRRELLRVGDLVDEEAPKEERLVRLELDGTRDRVAQDRLAQQRLVRHRRVVREQRKHARRQRRLALQHFPQVRVLRRRREQLVVGRLRAHPHDDHLVGVLDRPLGHGAQAHDRARWPALPWAAILRERSHAAHDVERSRLVAVKDLKISHEQHSALRFLLEDGTLGEAAHWQLAVGIDRIEGL